MAEKLVYLRTAFNALGKGLRVPERRRSARDNSRYNRMRPSYVPLPSVPLLSQAEFDRLAMADKLSYLSRAIREVRRMRAPASTS
jgi:hypothetical protein